MLAAGRVRSGRNKDRPATEGSTFTHFRRLLGYCWPHKRYLIPAVGCIVLMAVVYSVSLGSLLPVLSIIVKPQGLHGWVDQYIVNERFKCELVVYDALRHHRAEDIPAAAAMVRSIEPDSPLAGRDGLGEGDFILKVNGVPGDAVDVFRELSAPTGRMTLGFRSMDGQHQGTIAVEAPPLHTKQRALATAISYIPRGRTADERWWTLATVLGLLMIIALIGNLARVMAEYLTILVGTRAVLDLRRQMYSHVLKLPLGHFSRNTSDTMSKFIQDISDILRGLENFFQKLLTEPLKAVGAIVLAFLLNWKLSLVIILGAPFAVALFRLLGKKIRRANRKLLIGYGQMLGRLESTLTGMRVVKAYTREHYERKHLFKIDRRLLKQQLKMGFIEALTSPVVELLGFVGASLVIMYFARDMLQRPDKTPEFMTMLVCLLAIFDPVRKLSTIYPKLQRANAAAERVFGLIDSPSEYDQDHGHTSIQPIQHDLVFEDVTFTYPGTDRPAVRDFSLRVSRGETIAIVGPNGSGKTTLLSLLPRFYPVDSGRILIDGQDIATVTLRSLRRQFSIITQDSVIFPDTIRSNIAYGKSNATEEEIVAAARKAFADEFIQQIPGGYDAVAGEHGATLSGGQRQRIAIARAILRDAPLLIFDEATSQIDSESEQKIHQAVDVFLRDRTSFIIAHRFSTIVGADRIVVMDDGRLLDVGPHDELITRCTLYRSLYETQFRNGA